MIVPADPHQEIRDAVRQLCRQFPDAYFRLDEEKAYPDAFVDVLTAAGWLAAMIPQEYGGAGLGLTEASVVLEEINRWGGNSGAVHGQMYNMGTLLRHGSTAQKNKYLPGIASGKLRIQSMAVTEPTTGTDTTKIKTTAVKKDGRYVVNGQKVWISRVQHSDLMILLARTTPLAAVTKKAEGMSIFVVDLREAIGRGLTFAPIPNMVNHETNELFFDNLEVPGGKPGRRGRQGVQVHPRRSQRGADADRRRVHRRRLLVHRRATKYANERVVFDRPIGTNQGVQFPIAEAYIEVEAANLMRFKACELFDAHEPCGPRRTWRSTSPPRHRGRRRTCACRRTAASASPRNTTSSESSAETRPSSGRPISTNMIFATWPSTCLACRVRSEAVA